MSNKYTEGQKEIIAKGKRYFKSIREINKEKKSLEYEYIQLPQPKAIQYDSVPGESFKSKDQQFVSFIQYREKLLERINSLDKVINDFWIMTLFLRAKQRNVIQAYINTGGYTEMINLLDEKYQYCENTYTREIPNICLELSKYIDYDNLKEIDVY